MSLPLRGPIVEKTYNGQRFLRRALVVVQFSPVLKIADQTGAGIADFQDAIRSEYPFVNIEFERLMQLEVRPDGVHTAQQEQPVWRLLDADRKWRASLTTQTLALETNGESYTHWADFADRIQRLVRAVALHFSPAQKLRIGVRYANGAAAEDTDDPRQTCAPELVSISGDPDLVQSELLWRFTVDEGNLILRSGLLLPGTSYDPPVFEPPSVRTWYLDVDVFNDHPAAFDADEICDALLRQVQRVHAIYRWAIPGTSEGVLHDN